MMRAQSLKQLTDSTAPSSLVLHSEFCTLSAAFYCAASQGHYTKNKEHKNWQGALMQKGVKQTCIKQELLAFQHTQTL
jgi:hypothetical protein